jgi:hypothetical protein
MAIESAKQWGKVSFISPQKDIKNRRFITIIFLLLSAAPVCATEINKPVTCTENFSQVNKVDSNSQDDALTPLPATQLFEPLRADPKEPRFFVSTLKASSTIQNTTIAAVGFGENFGIVRHGSNPQQGWQLGISAAVFAQFDLESESSDLMNADYVIGVPVTWRHNDWSGRVRVYHQSSHLGDEFLLRVQPERVNLSFESIEVLVAHDFGGIRAYGGGEYLFHREPSDLAEGLVHVGLDWQNSEASFSFSHLGAARWVAGLDVKHWQQDDTAVQVSVKAGLEFAPLNNTYNSKRNWSVLMELYDGPSPYGQFYQDDLRYWGISIQLGL